MHRLTKCVILSVTVAGGAAALAIGPTTRPAGTLDELTVGVWTCPAHDQFRMTSKGECPICSAELISRKITLQGDAASGDVYPLATCTISGLPLGDKGPPVVMMHKGREMRFCCEGCLAKFEADPSEYLEQLDRKIVEQQLPYYPMTTCPVSGEPLGAMGDPVNFVYNNRLIRFCCNGCKRTFKKDPAAVLATLNAAVIEQQGDDYPVDECVISGQKLGAMGEPVDYVVANRLVRFCCNGCIAAFNKNPGVHLAALDKAWAGKHAKGGREHGYDHDHDGHGHDDH